MMIDSLRRLGIWPAERGHFRSVGRIVLLAGLVGVVAGLGAVAFQFLSQLVMKYGLELVAGYKPGGTSGDWNLFQNIRPLFGGFLTGPQMPPGASQLFEENGLNPVSSALRWVWNQPEPCVVLSGMGEKYQVKDNLRIVETADAGGLTEREKQVLEKVCLFIREYVPIACSKCGYCLKSCPIGVKIPYLFDLYNKHLLTDRKHALQPALYRGMLASEKASACIGCGECRRHCPQGLDIPAWLVKVAAEFEGTKG